MSNSRYVLGLDHSTNGRRKCLQITEKIYTLKSYPKMKQYLMNDRILIKMCSLECPSAFEQEQKHFTFDKVFSDSISTEQMYKEVYNVILFHKANVNNAEREYWKWLQHNNSSLWDDGSREEPYYVWRFVFPQHEIIRIQDQYSENGIISLCVDEIFLDSNVQKVSMSFLEIYNEQLRDLICDTPSASLMIVEDYVKGVLVQDSQEIDVKDSEQVRQLLLIGSHRRVMAATHANQVSSRSHAILQFLIISKQFTTKLSLVDLAGSERASVSDNKGLRMQEGANINRSLLALGNCINVLSERGGRKFVPYRDSKLTRLLKDALGGSTRTLMIACVSESMHCHEETCNTLKYASRARAIKKRVIQNIKPTTEAELLREENQRLRKHYNTVPENVLVDQLGDTIEEVYQIKFQIQQLESLQKLHHDGLRQELLYQKRIEEQGDRRQELEATRIEVTAYENKIGQNSTNRDEFKKRLLYLHEEKTRIINQLKIQSEGEVNNTLQRELESARRMIKERDEIIEKLKLRSQDFENLNNTTPMAVYNTESCKVLTQLRNPPELDPTYDTEKTLRESRRTSCICTTITQVKNIPPPATSDRLSISGRMSLDYNVQKLVQLNQARNNYRAFRSRLYQMKDEIASNIYGTITPNQVKQIQDLLQEIQENKQLVCQQDQPLITNFEQLIKQNNRPTPNSRSKSANGPRQKPSTSQHISRPNNPRSPLHIQHHQNQNQQNQNHNPKKRERSPRGMLSNQSRNYAQAVTKATKQSVQRLKDSVVIGNCSQTVGMLKNKTIILNENCLLYLKPQVSRPPKTSIPRGMSNSTMQPLSTVSPMINKQSQASFASIQDENPDIPKHYQRQIQFGLNNEELKPIKPSAFYQLMD